MRDKEIPTQHLNKDWWFIHYMIKYHLLHSTSDFPKVCVKYIALLKKLLREDEYKFY